MVFTTATTTTTITQTGCCHLTHTYALSFATIKFKQSQHRQVRTSKNSIWQFMALTFCLGGLENSFPRWNEVTQVKRGTIQRTTNEMKHRYANIQGCSNKRNRTTMNSVTRLSGRLVKPKPAGTRIYQRKTNDPTGNKRDETNFKDINCDACIRLQW